MFNFSKFLPSSFVLLEIRFPKIFNADVPNEKKLAAMEHFYNSIGDIKPHIVFEIAAPEKGNEIGFFIAVPEKIRDAVEKKISSFFPEAEIEAANNFNVINNRGVIAAAALKLKNNGRAPIQTYKKLGGGALESIVNAISSLEENGEGAAFQILIKPSEKNLFETNIRVVSSAETKERAYKILSDMEDAFTQFESPGFDAFYSFRPQGETLEKLIRDFSFRLFNKNDSTWFSAEELTGVFYWPIIKIESEKTSYLKARAAPPPSISPNIGIILGKNYFRGQETTIKLSPLDRRRHIHVTGQPAAGKKQFLFNLIKQDINGAAGIGIIDSIGDLVENALSSVPRSRRNNVVLFKPSGINHPVEIDAGDIIEKGKIFLADLSKNADNEAGRIFWERVLANKFSMAASEHLKKRERITNRDFHLYMNDFHDSTANSITEILSRTAKSRLNLNFVLANQNVFFDGVGTLVAFRSNPDNAKFLTKHFQSVFNEADLAGIDDSHAYIKTIVNGDFTTPFTIKIEN